MNSQSDLVDVFVHVRKEEVGEVFILFCPSILNAGVQEAMLSGELEFVNTWGHLGSEFLPIYYVGLALILVPHRSRNSHRSNLPGVRSHLDQGAL